MKMPCCACGYQQPVTDRDLALGWQCYDAFCGAFNPPALDTVREPEPDDSRIDEWTDEPLRDRLKGG